MVSDPLPGEQPSRTPQRARRPRGRGSNYEKKKWCPRCDARTTHLFDHGKEMHVCQECGR